MNNVMAVTIYTIVTLTDYATTAWGLNHGGVEKNQFMASLIAERGIEALLVVKIGGIVFMCFVLWLMKRLDEMLTEQWGDQSRIASRVAFGAIWLMVLTKSLIVVSNLRQMWIASQAGVF